jgi:hypothetical protein
MRLCHALLLIPLFSTPAMAENPPPTAPEHHGRRSAEQHFTDANTTHDGKLTLEQAAAGYKSIVKSFDQIDTQHHGYVTMEDIKAWKDAKKAARRSARMAAGADGVLRPSPAVQRGDTPRAQGTATEMMVPRPGRPHVGVDLPTAPLDAMHPS